MQLVKADLAVSLDGVAAGHDQSREYPFGQHVGGRITAPWMFEHPEDNRAEIDAIVDAGAFIMGRHMFGADRGEWDLEWQGWWGPEPPYHGPVFVLAHRPRPDLVMEGGTTFTFVTDGPEAALERARAAAGDQNVSIAGGPSTTNAFLGLGLIDELRLHVVPITLGEGIRIFEGVPDLQLTPVASRTTPYVTHLTWRRPAAG
jgi:dihydrofolate reductase